MSKSLGWVGTAFIVVGCALFVVAVGFTNKVEALFLPNGTLGTAVAAAMWVLGPVLMLLGCVALIASAAVRDWSRERQAHIEKEAGLALKNAGLSPSTRPGEHETTRRA